tara:strand:+ start:666 stop:1583 length:918 start_codon:yes stop_codon:yes gene_type:complete
MAQITEASLITELRLATALDTALHVLLHDAGTIRNTDAISYLGSINGTGAAGSRIREVGLDGYSPMVATADGVAAAATVPTLDEVDITVAKYSILRELTDLANLTGFGDDINPARLAQSVVGEYESAFMTAVGTMVATASTNVGTSGVNMSVDDYYDAVFQLELNSVPGPYYCLLAPRQLADLQESLRAEGGSTAFNPATAEMLKIKGQGYVGDFAGVSIHKSSLVTDNGTNYEGAMWGIDALGYKTATVKPVPGAIMTSPDREVVVEFNRGAGAAAGYTQIIGHAYFGMSILEQARIVGIVTDN